MELLALLDTAAAADEFKADVRAFAAHQPAPRIRTLRLAPRVKVVRLLTQLLSAERDLAIEQVEIDAVSGCSDFRGTISVEAGTEIRAFEFAWCCHWRATEQGWRDAFGFADQIRAAREFEWQCFEQWREVGAPGASAAR